jgi:hypothetical protein
MLALLMARVCVCGERRRAFDLFRREDDTRGGLDVRQFRHGISICSLWNHIARAN